MRKIKADIIIEDNGTVKVELPEYLDLPRYPVITMPAEDGKGYWMISRSGQRIKVGDLSFEVPEGMTFGRDELYEDRPHIPE